MKTQIELFTTEEIYEGVNALKENVDSFHRLILKKFPKNTQNTLGEPFGGLRNNGRINVFLAGEFSAGKTSFIRRLIGGKYAGAVSPLPETACLVVHKSDDVPSWEIYLNKKAQIKEDYKGFRNFIEEFNIDDGFEPVNDEKITSIENKITVDFKDEAKDWNFLENANKYPEIFVKIVWTHQKSTKNKLLEYVNLYDMPGIAGKPQHEEIIKNVFGQQRPDVIFYLINTSQGTLSEKDSLSLPELLKVYLSADNKRRPLFCFVYQKYDPEDNEILAVKRDNLNRYFKNIINADADENTDSKHWGIVRTITKLYKEHKDVTNYLSESFVLDARGEKTDTEKAQNAVSIVLREHICKIAGEYCKKAKRILEKDQKKLPAVMSDFPDNYSKNDYGNLQNPFIEENILKKMRETAKVKERLLMDDARRIIYEAFDILELLDKSENDISNDTNGSVKSIAKVVGDVKEITSSIWNIFINNRDDVDSNDKHFPFDLKATLKYMEKKIDVVIDDMCNVIRQGESRVDIHDIDRKFWEKYGKEPKWQHIVFYIQAYHWLRTSYDRITPPYIIDMGFYILENIKKDIDRLKKIAIPPSVFMKLDG